MAAGVVGAVLMLAGMAKLAGTGSSQGLPKWIEAGLPIAELVVGALVLAGFRMAGAAALVLLVLFTAWLARRLARGDHRPCGCFGETRGRPVSGWSIGRNIVLMAAAAIVMFGADRPSGWAGRAAGAVLGALMVVVESRPGSAGRTG